MKQSLFNFLNFGLVPLTHSERLKKPNMIYKGAENSEFPNVYFPTKKSALLEYRNKEKLEKESRGLR